MTMQSERSPWATGREGYYGDFGGSFTPEALHETLAELRAAFDDAWRDPEFWQSYVDLMATYAGRPTPVTYCENLTRRLGGARIYVKREDLNHTGAHKANNVMGQGLIVQRMGKKRVIAETGAGQHGVATATMAARLGLECTIYMGEEDIVRQHPNVFWMKQLGAEVVAVTEGTRTLKDAVNACLRDWAESMDDTHYVLGTACGPHPFPQMVTYFQSIIGQEARAQMLAATGELPRRVYACVGGGSNASGIFSGFLDDPSVELIGVEAGGRGLDTGEHAARLAGGQGAARRRAGVQERLPPERGGHHAGHVLGRGRPRLRRRRPDAGRPAPAGAGPLRGGDRRGGRRGAAPHDPERGDHPGSRELPRVRRGVPGGPGPLR
jgi:tryptophan synthase beta chain